MKQAVGVVGLACLAFGWVLALLLWWTNVEASRTDIFAGVVTGFSPGQSLYAFDCPDILGEHETGLVRATVLNSSATSHQYSIRIEAADFTVSGLPAVFTETISAGTTVSFTWRIQANSMNRAITSREISVSALSEEDLAQYQPPAPPPSWSTSYHQACSVGVIDLGGFTVGQATITSRISLLVGLVLTTWWGYTMWAVWRRRSG